MSIPMRATFCFFIFLILLGGEFYLCTAEEAPVLLRYKEQTEKETILMDKDQIVIQGHYTPEEKKMNEVKNLDRIYSNSHKQPASRQQTYIPQTAQGQTLQMDPNNPQAQLMQNLNSLMTVYQQQQLAMVEMQHQNMEAMMGVPPQGMTQRSAPQQPTKRKKFTMSKKWNAGHTRSDGKYTVNRSWHDDHTEYS